MTWKYTQSSKTSSTMVALTWLPWARCFLKMKALNPVCTGLPLRQTWHHLSEKCEWCSWLEQSHSGLSSLCVSSVITHWGCFHIDTQNGTQRRARRTPCYRLVSKWRNSEFANRFLAFLCSHSTAYHLLTVGLLLWYALDWLANQFIQLNEIFLRLRNHVLFISEFSLFFLTEFLLRFFENSKLSLGFIHVKEKYIV